MKRATSNDSENENNNYTRNEELIDNESGQTSGEIECVLVENLHLSDRPKEKYLHRINKIKRNSGQAYYTSKEKFIPAKEFKHKNCNCKRKCIEKVNERECKEIFDNFWKLSDFNLQNIFLYSSVQRNAIKRRKSKSNQGIKRAYHYKFHLVTSNGDIIVCKKFFIDTLQISGSRMDRILKLHNNIPIDKRGKMEGSRTTISEERRKTAVDHINSYPALESHYTRETNPARRYLNPGLTIIKMYNAYLENCKENNISSPVSKTVYRRILKKDLNLSFDWPHKNRS